MIKYNIIKLDAPIGSITGISELSGLCFNHNKTKLFAISDTGKVYTISNINGVINNNNVELYSDVSLDIEGITNIPKDGQDILYLAVERDKNIDDDLNSYIYKLDQDKNLEKVSDITNTKTEVNKGLEGITKYTSDVLLIGNQANPVCIKQFSIPRTKVIQNFNIGFTSEIADLYYDETSDTIWILNSNDSTIHICSDSFAQIQTIKLDIDPYYNPEALVVDTQNKIIWVGCDTANQTNLYKIRYTVESTEIKSVYFMRHALEKVMKGAKIIWTKISSCFGSGFWRESTKWSEQEYWKD